MEEEVMVSRCGIKSLSESPQAGARGMPGAGRAPPRPCYPLKLFLSERTKSLGLGSPCSGCFQEGNNPSAAAEH